MAPTRVLLQESKSSQRSKAAREPYARPTAGSDNDVQMDSVDEKDETELRLEKILFGDEAGFLESLKDNNASRERALLRVASPGSSEDDEEEDLAQAADEDLFFLDSGTGDLPQPLTQDTYSESERQPPAQKRKAVWYDSDDDRIRVSLASNTRLRKLRETEVDDVVTGREYIRRLRIQYERLHPAPEWAKQASRNRRKFNNNHDQQDSDALPASDLSSDDESSIPMVQPLADLLRSGGALVRASEMAAGGNKRRKLRPEVIDIQRTSDVAQKGLSSIDTLQFHPQYPLLLSSGPSSTIQLYHISPQPPNPNPLLTSMHVRGTPVHTAAFHFPRPSASKHGQNQPSDTTQVFFASRRRYFHIWSLSSGTAMKVSRPVYGAARKEQRTVEFFKLSPDGSYMALLGSGRKGGGSVNVLSTQTMQWVTSCRVDSQGGVADFAWWRNSQGFAIVGKNGEVSEYDVESKRIVARWHDEGAVGTTVISLGGELSKSNLGQNRWVAVGSSSGIVNIYDRQEWNSASNETQQSLAPKRPKPARVLDQLTTPISHLVFSNGGQMLVMASRWKKNALRIVHLPSCTVYRNWPTDKTPLGRVSSVAVSMDGHLLAVGNEQGKIRLWEIRD